MASYSHLRGAISSTPAQGPPKNQILALQLHRSKPPPRLNLGFSPPYESTGHWVRFQWLSVPQDNKSLISCTGDPSNWILPVYPHLKAQRVGTRLSAQVCLCGCQPPSAPGHLAPGPSLPADLTPGAVRHLQTLGLRFPPTHAVGINPCFQ